MMTLHASRQFSEAGTTIDRGVRSVLEQAFAVDLSGVRLHSGPQAGAFLRSRGLTAAAAGHRVFLPARGRGRGGEERWLRMLAHEVAHTIQQAQGLAQAGLACEAGAERAAGAVAAGREVPAAWLSAGGELEPPRAGHGAAALAGFNSWEHQLLGDLPGDQLAAIAARSGNWAAAADAVLAMLSLWRPGRQDVTADQLRAALPGVNVVTLGNGCLATYGELCALADFIAGPEALESAAGYLFPFLQQIRQETYNRLAVLRDPDSPVTEFNGSIYRYVDPASISAPVWQGLEVAAIDRFSAPLGVDHYQGLLARNACHFAPWVWYRWKTGRDAAIQTATRAQGATGPERERLTSLAWAQQAYGEHFLQDCFAAGHLTNKTAVMQYFLEWAGNSYLIPVRDWASVSQLVMAHQPGLWGEGLYSGDPELTRLPNDPQSVEEQPSFALRVERSGVLPSGLTTREQAYHQYLAFLRSAVVQLSSNQVHDYYNAHGLYVSADSGPRFQVFGDGYLLNTTAQVQVMVPVLGLARQTVPDVLREAGAADVSAVMRQVPRHVVTQASPAGLTDLKTWNLTELRSAVPGILGSGVSFLKQFAGGFFPDMGAVSADELAGGLTQVWSTDVGGSVSSQVSVHWDGQRLFAGAGGMVCQLSAVDGERLASSQLFGAVADIAFAADGDTLYAGADGRVVALDSARKLAQTAQFDLGTGSSRVFLLMTDDGHLYAGAAGQLWELDPVSLASAGFNQFGGFGAGDLQMAAVGGTLVCGTNNQVICLDRGSELARPIGPVVSLHPDDFYYPVAVLGAGPDAFVASSGILRSVDVVKGGLLDGGQDNRLIAGADRLATDGNSLYWSAGGRLMSFALPDPGSVRWTVPLAVNGIAPPNSAPGDVLCVGSNVYAGLNDTVFQIDPATGTIMNQTRVGDRSEIRLASDGINLYVGTTRNRQAGVAAYQLNRGGPPLTGPD
jgi:hypothetical protein